MGKAREPISGYPYAMVAMRDEHDTPEYRAFLERANIAEIDEYARERGLRAGVVSHQWVRPLGDYWKGEMILISHGRDLSMVQKWEGGE